MAWKILLFNVGILLIILFQLCQFSFVLFEWWPMTLRSRSWEKERERETDSLRDLDWTERGKSLCKLKNGSNLVNFEKCASQFTTAPVSIGAKDRLTSKTIFVFMLKSPLKLKWDIKTISRHSFQDTSYHQKKKTYTRKHIYHQFSLTSLRSERLKDARRGEREKCWDWIAAEKEMPKCYCWCGIKGEEKTNKTWWIHQQHQEAKVKRGGKECRRMVYTQGRSRF